jgi:hypothetical protein
MIKKTRKLLKKHVQKIKSRMGSKTLSSCKSQKRLKGCRSKLRKTRKAHTKVNRKKLVKRRSGIRRSKRGGTKESVLYSELNFTGDNSHKRKGTEGTEGTDEVIVPVIYESPSPYADPYEIQRNLGCDEVNNALSHEFVHPLLMKEETGTYVIRNSKLPGFYGVLAVKGPDKILNYRIKEDNEGQYKLDQTTVSFNNITLLLEHYKKNSITKGQEVVLKKCIYVYDGCSGAKTELGREQAELLLMNKELETGTYVIRDSSSAGVYGALSVKGLDKIYHYKILKNDEGQYKLDQTTVSFDNITLLVEHFKSHYLNDVDENKLVLKKCIYAQKRDLTETAV